MIRSSLLVRRIATILGVAVVLALGAGSIRAAAAWTAASAPLIVAPESVTSLEGRLADERARSAALQSQLSSLDGQSQALVSALEAAKAQIDADSSHAKDLSAKLDKATKKLVKLEKLIADSRKALANRAAVRAAPAPAAKTHHEDREDDHGGDDGHD